MSGVRPDKADPLGEMLAWAAALRYEDLPVGAVRASKAYVLNTLAAMLAGSAAPGAREAVRAVQGWGGAPQSTVAVHGFRTAAPFAAFANGVMAHAMDYDDTQVGTGFHPNVSIIPALLAASETARDADGRAFLVAYTAGLEIACRMTLAATNRAAHPWLTTTLFGVFGAAIAAGRVWGLGAQRLRHAAGIVYSSAGGNRQGLLDGALIQRVQPGLCAQAAVTAAQLAQEGLSGARDALEGRYGLYPSYYGLDYEPQTLTQALGSDYRLLDLALKPYPCCSYSQEPIEAACQLAREPGFTVGAVAEALAWVPSAHAAGLVDHPYSPRECPQVDAQFSLQYVIAASLRSGELGLADFHDSALRDPEVIALAARVRVRVDPQKAGTVELRMADGSTRGRRVPVARGHPSRPFSETELRSKLEQCARYAASPSVRPQRLEQLVGGLETLKRAGELAEALA